MTKQPKKPAPGKRTAKKKAKAPVARNGKTKGAKAACPRVVRRPCDVTSFKMIVLPCKRGDATDDPNASAIEIEVKRPMRSPGAVETRRYSRLFGKPIARLLQHYDFVIETVASFHFQSPAFVHSTPPETTIDVVVEAAWEGKCAQRWHPRLHMRPLTTPGRQLVKAYPSVPGRGSRFVPTTVTWPVGVKRARIQGITALATSADLFMGQDAITTLLRVIFFAMQMNQSVDLSFWADGHGVPVNPKARRKRLLNGVVRIFRDVQVGIAITIPMGKKVVEELHGTERLDHSKRWPAVGGTRTEKDFRGGFKHERPRNDHGWSFGGLERLPKDRYALALKLNDFEIILKDDDRSWAEIKQRLYANNMRRTKALLGRAKSEAERARLQAKLAVELRHILSLSEYLHVAWRHLVRGVKGIRAGMAALIQAFKKAPQCGWKFEYELTFLAVGASVTFSRKSSSKVLANRVVRLQWNGKLELKLTLLEVKATLSFGILVDLTVVRLEARVFGTLGGVVEAAIECSLLDDTKAGFKGQATGKLGAVFEARAFWRTIRKEIAIETGFVTEGGLTWKGSEKKLAWELKMRSLPVQWYVVATNARTGEQRPRYHTLARARKLAAGSGSWDLR